MMMISLRGGGGACSKKKMPDSNRDQFYFLNEKPDNYNLGLFFSDLQQKCEKILAASQKIGLQQSKDDVIQEIKWFQLSWFQLSSQYLNQIIYHKTKVHENKLLIFKSLGRLLKAVLNIIQSQFILSYHLLKICNQISQLIFTYCYNSSRPSIPFNVQISYLNILVQIDKQIENGQSNFCQNSIIYELEVIKMCINTCPTNSTQGEQILISTFKGVFSSLSKMSPSGELVTALLDGVQYVYQKVQQNNQKKIFQVIFYLEQLKWKIIEKVQTGKSIRMSLNDNYEKLIKVSNQWIIKCSWIKLISDLIQYMPNMTELSGFKLLKKSFLMLNTKIYRDQNIGHTSNIVYGDMVGALLDQLQSICIFPKIDNFVNKGSEINEEDKQQKLLKILEIVDSLQIRKLSNMYQQLLESFYDYIVTLYSLGQQDNQDITQQQIKVELLIIKTQKLDALLQKVTINSQIINKQLHSFIRGNEQYNDQLITFHYYQLHKNYFNIIQMIGILDEQNIEDQQLFSPTFHFDQTKFIEIFPEEFKSKIIININEFQDTIKQLKKIDLKQIIKIVDDRRHKSLEFKPNEYSILLNWFVSVIFKQIREYLINQEQELQFIQQAITKTNQISNRIKNDSIQQCLVYFSIIKHMKFMYQEIDQFVENMKFSDKDIMEFKILSITDILTIYNDHLKQEEQILIVQNSNKVLACINHSNLDKLKEIQIFLWTLKQLEQNKKKRIQKFNQFAEIFKSRCRALLEQNISKNQQYLQMLKENGEILLNNIKKGNSIQELYTILDKRKIMLQNIQQEQKNNKQLNQQIQNEIIFTSILNQEHFYDSLETNKEQFLNNINESNNQIIAYLQEILNESNQQENFNQIISSIMEKLDQLTVDINKPFKQEGDYLKQSQNLNSLIFKIQNFIFGEKQITNEILQYAEKELEPIIEFYGQLEKIDTKIICDLIKDIHQSIDGLPNVYQVQLTDFLIQDKNTEQATWETQSKQISQNWKQKLIGIFESDAWRQKEYFYFCCLYTFSLTNNQQVKQSLGRIILFGKYLETDYRIRATLKNKEYQQSVEQLVNSEWDNTKEKVQESLQTTLNQLQSIQLQLQGEERKAQRDDLVQQHKDLEQQLEQQIKNVSEIGDILGITINFMKDIKKELISIQSKLDNMIDSINQIGQDIKFLRGKTPQQLLEIRMEQVLYNKYIQDSSSVYVQIQVKEFNFENMEEEKNTPLFNYDQHDNGEIDEYLDNSIQTSLLIHGIAGSGKSISARKIEEYLWLKYKKKANNQIWTQQINLDIPIFIQLPILKEPQFNSIEETLLSSIYNFDQKQVNQLLDFVQNSKIKLIFIFDSYDELSTQYIGKNLIQSNKIYQWKNKNDLINPKVITTTRTEIFTNTLYRKWFCEKEMAGFQNFKEIRLLPFNQDQRKEFLIQFSQLQLKLQIKDLLEIISKKKTQNIIIEDTLQIYDQLEIGTSQKQEYLLNQNQIIRLLQIIKAHPNVININSDQEISFNKQLQNIWSVEKFQQSIKQTEIEELLDTPFMLNIVVQVLPQMNEILSSQNYIKDFFKASFVIEKSNQIKSIINRYESKNSFVTQVQKYNQEDINQLKKFIDKQNPELLIQESRIIWDSLIESNFFKDYSNILEYEDIIKLLQKLNFQENITKRERDIDNWFIIYKALTSKKSTIYEFYQIFFNNYTEKQRMKLIYSNDIKDQISFQIDIERYAVQFAVTMTVLNKTTIEVKPKGILFRGKQEESPFEKFFEDLDQNANYKNLIRKCLPLRQKANFYSFNHKTIQEYLFAKDVLDFLSQVENSIDQLIALRNLDPMQRNSSIASLKIVLQQYEDCSLNQVNLGDSSLFGTFKFIRIAIKQNERFQEVCYKLSLLSIILNQLLRLSSNSFYILISAQTTLKNKDFSKIFIADTQINSTIFKNCNFSDSIFQRVQMNGVNFSNSDLSRANWTSIQTNDLPRLWHLDKNDKDNKNGNEIQCISYSYDDQFIIVGDIKGFIYVWDKSQVKCVKKFQSDHKIIYINQIRGNILISLSENQTQLEKKDQQGQIINERKCIIKVWDKDYNQVASLELIDQGNNEDISKLFTHNNDFIAILYKQDAVRVIQISDCKTYKQHDFNQKLIKIQIDQTQNVIYLITYKDLAIIKWDFTNDNPQEIQTNINQLNLERDLNYESIFSYDCKLLMIKFQNEEQNIIKIFNILNKQIQDLKFSHKFNKFSLCGNNKYLGLINESELFVYDFSTQSRLFYIKLTKTQIGLIQFNKESTQMITAQEKLACKLWDVKLLTNKQNLNDEFDQIYEAQQSPDGHKIYYSKQQGKSEQLYVAEIKTGEQLDQIKISFHKFKVCLSGRYVYFIDDELNLIQYDLNQKKQVQLFKFPTEYRITQINQSHDHRVFAISYKIGQSSENQSKILIFDYDATKIIREVDIKAHQIIFSYDGRFLYYVQSQIIKSLEINYEQIQQEFQNNLEQTEWANKTEIHDFLITTQDDKYIIFCEKNQILKKFDICNKQKSDVCNLPATQIKSFNQYLMVWALETVFVYNFDFQLIGKQQLDKRLTVCINNKQFLSIDDDNVVKIWKIDKKKLKDRDESIFKMKIIMPKNRISKQIISNVKWDDSKIQSHFNIDLKKYWTETND